MYPSAEPQGALPCSLYLRCLMWSNGSSFDLLWSGRGVGLKDITFEPRVKGESKKEERVKRVSAQPFLYSFGAILIWARVCFFFFFAVAKKRRERNREARQEVNASW